MVQPSNNIYFKIKKSLLLLFTLIVFTLPSKSYAIFQIKFFGGPLIETEDSSATSKKGTFFKTLVAYGSTFRFTGSFSYSQSSMGTINIIQGEVGFGTSFFPHYSEPVPFLLPYFHTEAVALLKTEDQTSNADLKEQSYSGAVNIAVGLDINLSRTFGFTLGTELHNFKEHRTFIGFLQGY